MRVVIVGAGALGSVIGGCLARAGEEVILVDVANPHLEAIARQGLTVTGFQNFSIPVQATDRPSEIKEADFLLLITKSMDTEKALQGVGHVSIPFACSIQNGVAKEERLARVFGKEKVVGGLTLVAAQRKDPGVVEWTSEGVTYFGEWEGGISPRVRNLVETFQRANLKAEAKENILSLEWSKFISWAATGMISALTRLPFPRILRTPELASLLVRMVRELSRIPAAQGISLEDCGPHRTRTMVELSLEAAVQEVMQAGARVERPGVFAYHSTAQDILAGRKTEMEDCIGPLVEEARQRKIEIPLTQAVYALALGLEASIALQRGR
ncbi:MAG: 2-dehydropantoate 2-reductase [candidate division NC10 bacterium]|nr:2-dehydropantoate 2-reductase [candidate division NC10 bacterium]